MSNPVIEFVNDAWKHQKSYVLQNAKLCKQMLTQDSAQGQTVMICGAGPSLAQWFDEAYDKVKPDAVWGCNSALTWLWESGRPVTHGVAVAGEDGLMQDWKSLPPVIYYLASCVWPVVTKRLLAKLRKVYFFHTYIGLEPPKNWTLPKEAVNHTYDTWFYSVHYPFPNSFMVDGGLNVTNRAVGVADAMGYSRIIVLGADCCLKMSDDEMPVPPEGSTDKEASALNQEWCSRQQMYADGRDAKTAFGQPTLMEGWIGGRRWVTRSDMLESARWLMISKQQMGKRLELVGDTLPNWLLRQSPEELEKVLPQIKDGLMTHIGTKRDR